MRWYVEDDGAGLCFTAYAMRSEDRLTSPWVPGRPLERSIHAAATVGWRWRWSDFFLEASAGPVFHYDRQYLATGPRDSQEATVTTNVGLFYDTALSSSGAWFVPTVDLGQA